MPIELKDLTIPVWIYDIDNYCIHWANQPALELWESNSLSELCSRDFKQDNSQAVEARVREYQRAFLESNVSFYENWHFVPKGVPKSVFCQFSGYVLDNNRMALLIQGMPTAKLGHDLQVNLTAMLSDYTVEGRLISGNPPFLNAMGRRVAHLQDMILSPAVLKTIYRSLSQSGRYEDDVLMEGVNGEHWYHLIAANVQDDTGQEKILLHQYDIHRRKMSEINLAKEVLTDSLTGLLNRRGLDKRLAEFAAGEANFDFFYIDLDGFKIINDSFGHGVGDQVLQTVADRLLDNSPDNSAVCRFGGDEFVVVVPIHLKSMDDAVVDKDALADQLVKVLSNSYYHDTQPMTLSASVGVAQYPQDTDDLTNIVLYADAAMYQAKRLGKHRWVNYTAGIEQVILRQGVIAQSLSRAQSRGELELYYQPIWEVSRDGSVNILSFEALLRWHNHDIPDVTTEEVIQVAESIGIINDIECWVVNQALTDLLYLRAHVSPNVTMSINVSAVHLREVRFPQCLSEALEDKGLSPQDLIIELTESALVENMADHNSVVRQLVEQGINISIDDFGTGYSSLAYLHQIPATTAKIDRSFVEQVESNTQPLRHIRSLIEAHGMKALVEGVETQEQKDKLLDCGITLQQGFFLGRPKPLDYYIKNKTTGNCEQ